MDRILFFCLICCFQLCLAGSLKKGGSGHDNGGTGYSCEIKDRPGVKVTILLDLFENLEEFYAKEYFTDHYEQGEQQFFLPRDWTKVKSYTSLFKYSLDNHVDVYDFRLREVFKSPFYRRSLLKKIQKSIKFISSTYLVEYIYFSDLKKLYQGWYEDVYENWKTKDVGLKKQVNKKTLNEYGLINCTFVQVVALETLYKRKDFVRRQILIAPLKAYFIAEFSDALDELSFRALLWHEIIYNALKDENSAKTRDYVRATLSALNFNKL